MLSLKQLDDICLVNSNSSERCRYLTADENEFGKFYCMKLSSRREQIDEEVEEYLVEMRRLGRDPNRDNLPLGDNCQGYPLFRNIEQGYDKH